MKNMKYIIIILLVIVISLGLFGYIKSRNNEEGKKEIPKVDFNYENTESFNNTMTVCSDSTIDNIEECENDEIIIIKTENEKNNPIGFTRNDKYFIYSDGNIVKLYDLDNEKSVNLGIDLNGYFSVEAVGNNFVYLSNFNADKMIISVNIYDFINDKMIEFGKYRYIEQCGNSFNCYVDELYEDSENMEDYYYVTDNNIYDKSFNLLIDDVTFYSTYEMDKIIVLKDNDLIVYNYNNKELNKVEVNKEIVGLTNNYTFYVDMFNLYIIDNKDIITKKDNAHNTGIFIERSIDDKSNNIYDIFEYEEEDPLKTLVSIIVIDESITKENYKKYCKQYNNCDYITDEYEWYGYDYMYDPKEHTLVGKELIGGIN